MDDNFNFDLVTEFRGYASSRDKTNIARDFLVKNSKNMIKKLSGTIANRDGIKAYGPLDGSDNPVISSYTWNNNFGNTRPIRLTKNGTLDVMFNGAWYNLMNGITAARASFASWYEFDEGKDRLVFVLGNTNVYHWSGGVAVVNAGVTKNGMLSSVSGIIAAGSGYVVGDVLSVTGAGSDGLGRLQVVTINGSGGITAATITATGSGYTAGTFTPFGGTGTGFQLTLNTVNGGTLTIKDGTSWASNGFASEISAERTFTVNSVVYSYTNMGTGTNTLLVVTPDPSAIPDGTLIIQGVQTESNLTGGQANSISITTTNDFIEILNGQVFLASLSSRVIYISAQSQTGLQKGFVDFGNVGDLIPGDPDLFVLDAPPTAMKPKEGHMYVSSGSSDWYVVTPNTNIPIEIPVSGSNFRLVTTDVQKIPGTALVACLGPDFIENVGGDILYVSQDNQLRKIATVPGVLNVVRFPSLSLDLYNELYLEDFTGGHLRSIGEYIYITAPKSGRHYMHQTRDRIQADGSVLSERIWHTPQVSGISRFESINGVTYGYSNKNPMTYQIWDTNQWHDDGVDSNNNLISLPYECVMSTAYREIIGKEKQVLRFSKQRFDKVACEGYISAGTKLYGNIYYDYQGSTFIKGIYINGVKDAGDSQTDIIKFIKSAATLFSYIKAITLGSDFLGDNPLGNGITPFTDEQDYLPKFRKICKVPIKYCHEYAIDLYSYDEDARWEVLALGANAEIAPDTANELVS